MTSIEMMSSNKHVHFRSKVNGKNRSVIIRKTDAKQLYENVMQHTSLLRFYPNASAAVREGSTVTKQHVYETIQSFVKANPFYAISNPRRGQYFYIRKVS